MALRTANLGAKLGAKFDLSDLASRSKVRAANCGFPCVLGCALSPCALAVSMDTSLGYQRQRVVCLATVKSRLVINPLFGSLA